MVEKLKIPFKFRNMIYCFCAAAVSAALLAGCSAERMPEEAAGTRTKEETILLSVLAGQSTSDAGIEDMIDDFLKEEFPHVKLEWECVDWGESFESQLRGRIAAGDAPDILVGKAQDVGSYAREGILAPIRMEQLAAIDGTALETVTVDGEVYGMP